MLNPIHSLAITLLCGALLLFTQSCTHLSTPSLLNSQKSKALDNIEHTLDRYKTRLFAPYRKARRIEPGLEGDIWLNFAVDSDGRVTECNILKSTLDNRRLTSQMCKRIERFNFFSADSDPSIEVKLYLSFTPDNLLLEVKDEPISRR